MIPLTFRKLRPALAAAALAAATPGALGAVASPARADEPGWATARAAELTRQGDAHAARGEPDTAAQRYQEALRFDATYGPAYLALGALRERAGEPQAAEEVYARGLERIAGFAEAHRARAALRLRQRRTRAAIEDLEAAEDLRPGDAAILDELARAYVTASAFPAALAATRRLAALATAAGDPARAAEARTRARALSILVGEADPVRAGQTGRGPVRSALARLATGAAGATPRPKTKTLR